MKEYSYGGPDGFNKCKDKAYLNIWELFEKTFIFIGQWTR